MTPMPKPPDAWTRARRLGIAAGLAFAVDLLFVGLLVWPGLVPAAHRQALVVLDLVITAMMAALLLLLLIELARSFKARHEALERQQMVFDALPNGLALWGPDDRLELANADFVQLYKPVAELLAPGLRFEDLLRAAVQRGLVPEAAGREHEWIARRLEQHRHPREPMLRRLPDGRWRRIAEHRLADGRILSHSIDVSELVAARAEVDLARRRLEDAIEALPAGFDLYDADDRLVITNSVLKSMYPRVADLLEQPLSWEAVVRENFVRGGLPDVGPDFEAWLQRRREQRLSCGPPRIHALPDGRWVRTYERRTREGGIVGVRIDISESMRQEHELRRLNADLDAANAELRRAAGTDALTGIANRRSFDERLMQAWEAGADLALLMLDVDHFKRYNDRHGHPAGDAALRRVAAVLVASCRAPSDLAARIGGEEFAVLMTGVDGAVALSAAERCLALLADADIAHADSPIGPRITASVGLALRGTLPAGAAAAQLMSAADAALYAAKAQGRNRVAVAGR